MAPITSDFSLNASAPVFNPTTYVEEVMSTKIYHVPLNFELSRYYQQLNSFPVFF